MPKKTSKIEELLQEWVQVTEAAAKNPVDYKIHIRAALEGQVVSAKRRLPELRREIQEATIPERVVAIFGTGDTRKIAKFLEDNDGVEVSVDRLYYEINDLVEPSYSSHRVYNTAQHGLTVQAMKIILERVGGLDVMDVPKYKEAICSTQAESVDHIRSLMQSAPDNDIQARYVAHEITESVIAGGLTGKTIPVLVLGADGSEIENLSKLFKKTVQHHFTPEFEPTQESVVKILKS